MYYVEIHVEKLTFDPVGDGGIKSVCMIVKMYRVRLTKKTQKPGFFFRFGCIHKQWNSFVPYSRVGYASRDVYQSGDGSIFRGQCHRSLLTTRKPRRWCEFPIIQRSSR